MKNTTQRKTFTINLGMHLKKSGWALVCLLCTTMAVSGCSQKKGEATPEVTDTEQAQPDTSRTAPDSLVKEPADDNETAVSSLTFKVIKAQKADNNVACYIEMDFPVSGDEPLLSGTRQAVLEAIGVKGKQNLENAQRLANKAVADMYKELAETNGAGEEEEEEETEEASIKPIYTEDISVKLFFRAEKFLTFKRICSAYTGGPHEISATSYLTIDAQTGKKLSFDDLFAPSVRKQLKKMVRQALVKQYYHGDGSSLSEGASFSLPDQTPSLTGKGVHFIYNPYEIDCFAAGSPECLIPYAQIKSLMTPQAQSLIP